MLPTSAQNSVQCFDVWKKITFISHLFFHICFLIAVGISADLVELDSAER